MRLLGDKISSTIGNTIMIFSVTYYIILVAQAADVPTMPWSGSDIKVKVPDEFVEVSCVTHLVLACDNFLTLFLRSMASCRSRLKSIVELVFITSRKATKHARFEKERKSLTQSRKSDTLS